MTTTALPTYCTVDQVKARLYSGLGKMGNADQQRDQLLGDLVYALSRRFEKESGRNLGDFAPTYDARLYSGQGRQMLDVDEFASLSKFEWNSNPVGAPSWNNITADVGNGLIVTHPIRFWPKRQVFRQLTWVVDPYRQGNVRLTGVWGAVQPDMGAAQPAAPWQGLATAGAIQALAPDPTQTTGWWIVPQDIQMAVAEWAVYEFKAGQAGYSDVAGHPGGAGVLYSKGIPPQVAAVIQNYKGGKLKLALIGLDGSNVADYQAGEFGGYDARDPRYRWAGWHTTDGVF